MNKITIIPISTLRIELSNMSFLLASVLNELQWFLEILVPNAIILLRIESKVLQLFVKVKHVEEGESN